MEKTITCCVILHNMLIDDKYEPKELPPRLPFETEVISPIPNQPALSHTELQFLKMDMQSIFKHAYLFEDLIAVQWARLARERDNNNEWETESTDD